VSGQSIDLLINAKNASDAAFKQLEGGLGGVDARLKSLVPSTEAWSSAQQKAAMRMENWHEEAVKMDAGFKSSDDGAQRFAATMGNVSSSITSTAAAFGMPVGPLTALNSATDVASLGMGKLTSSSVGFDSASVGVAAAGLAVGAAIGTWLRTFPAVAKAADDAAASLYRLAQSQEEVDAQFNATQGLSKWQAEMAASHEAAQKRQVQAMRDSGASISQILDMLNGKHETSKDKIVDGLEEEQAALKKTADEAERTAAKMAKLAEKTAASISGASVTMTGWFDRMPNAIKPSTTAVIDFSQAMATEIPIGADRLTELGAVIATSTGLWTRYADVVDQELENASAAVAEHAEATISFQQAFSTAMSGIDVQFGAQFGPIGAAVGAAAGGLLGWIGSANRAREEARRLAAEARQLAADIAKMRDKFIESQGGLDTLEIAAREAGVSLEAMWNAKTVERYQAAVDKTKEAMDRWGLTVEQMGPAFQSQMLHEGLAELWQDFALLQAGGADLAALLGGEMGTAINTLVGQSIDMGVALPEGVRPMIEEMIRLGLLFDSAGNQITDISQLTFTETLEAGVARLITQIERLVNALLGIPEEVNTSVNVNTNTGGGGLNGHTNDDGSPDYDHNPTTPMAEGGWLPFRAGGHHILAGEAGDEAIIPAGKLAGIVSQVMAMTGGSQGGGRYSGPAGMERVIVRMGYREIVDVQTDNLRRNTGGVRNQLERAARGRRM
jgi:DNA-binding transcriptional MerR regulator